MRHETMQRAREKLIFERLVSGKSSGRLYDPSATEWNKERNRLINRITEDYNNEVIDLDEALVQLDAVYMGGPNEVRSTACL